MVECAEEDAKQLAQVHVVGCLFEPQSSAVVEVHGKLCWEPLDKRESVCERREERERKRKEREEGERGKREGE